MKLKSAYQDIGFKWSYEQATDLRDPDPYDILSGCSLRELDAPDGSTTFLVVLDHFDEGSGLVRKYAIEAPAGSPMREAFEWGELTWDEYWTHKDELYELIVPFYSGPVLSRIIAPTEMSQGIKQRFADLGEFFPYELKRQQLELRVKYAAAKMDKLANARHEYDAFMEKYGHRFAKRAA